MKHVESPFINPLFHVLLNMLRLSGFFYRKSNTKKLENLRIIYKDVLPLSLIRLKYLAVETYHLNLLGDTILNILMIYL